MDAANPTPEPWRAVLTALASPRVRRTLAELIVESDPPLSAAERREARHILMRSGLLTSAQQLDERALRSMLANGPLEDEGVDRWLRADGRIRQLPTSPEDRRELLNWITERLMGSEEVLAEKPLTQRLVAFTSDPNTLRRALVDAGLLARNADGSDYRRTLGG